MRVLAIDTTSEHGGAAVYNQDVCLAMALNQEPASRYAVTLFGLVEQALEQARISFADIDLYAVSNGPGSFTGIRVGLAAAQGWAKAFQKPAIGVNLLEAMIEQARPDSDWAVPVLDARRGEFYAGFYRRPEGDDEHQSRSESAGPGQLVRPERFAAMLEALSKGGQCRTFSGGSIVCLTRSHDLKARTLCENLSRELAGMIEVSGALLEPIARLALRTHERGGPPSPEDLDACYIRRSDAEMNLRPSALKAGK